MENIRIRFWSFCLLFLVALVGCSAAPDVVNKKVRDTYPGAQEIGRSHRDGGKLEMRALCENGRVRVILIYRDLDPTIEQEMVLNSSTTCK